MKAVKIFVCVVIAVSLLACTTSAERKREQDKAEQAALAYTQLGIEHLREGNYELSLDKLQKAIEIDPNFALAHGSIAILYEKVGDDKLAEKHYKKALRLNPDDSGGHNNYGQFLCFQERYKEATKEFMEAAGNRFYATPAVPLTNAGLCAKRIPDMPLAEQYFRQALQLDEKFAPALLQMALIKFEQGAFLSARAYLQRFQEVAKHNPESLWLAVRTEFALKDESTSGHYAILLRENFPKSEQAILLLEWENERRPGR
jgi:type IV pilus assembly protein PilF